MIKFTILLKDHLWKTRNHALLENKKKRSVQTAFSVVQGQTQYLKQ